MLAHAAWPTLLHLSQGGPASAPFGNPLAAGRSPCEGNSNWPEFSLDNFRKALRTVRSARVEMPACGSQTGGELVVPNRGEGPILELGPDPMLELGPDGVAAPGPGHTLASAAAASTPPVPPPVVQPLSPGRYKVQFTASAEFHQKLERLRALMCSRGRLRGCDLAAVIEQAVTEKLERLQATRFARTRAPRKGPAETKPEPSPSARHIPAA